ncbi:CvpA family protein [Caenimonas sedimenti]|uniref:CvpA family protein n=1 Tax=Caenimonas sedimenti TaxID=2596921 RepID=A0A562ZXV7_9BURK|nr:CvpA family protein [Caenimonas sedimenti]TWO72974.1 CvpA family protein [Caenimonas sedimenti]
MSTLDWVVAGLFLASMAIGLWRGLVAEVLSVLSWVAAFVLAQWFAAQVGELLPMDGYAQPLRYAAGFLAVFIAVLMAGALLIWLSKKLLEAVGLRPLDRVLGMLFGAVRAGLLVLVLGVLVHLTGFRDAPWWRESFSAGVATAALRGWKPVLPEAFGKHLPE